MPIRFAKSIVLPTAFALAAPLAVFAQNANQSANQGAGKSTAQEQASRQAAQAQLANAGQAQNGTVFRASKMIGKEVQNSKGEKLGELHDLVIDVNRGFVPYAILSFGGILGMGEKLFVYPMTNFKPAKEDLLVLDVDKDKLKDAPSFSKDKLPNFNDNVARGEINRYFKGDPDKNGNPIGQTWRVSEMLGKSINERSGRNAGEIVDVVINREAATVQYMVVAFDKAWSPDSRLMILPLAAVDFPARTDLDPIINIRSNQLSQVRSFEKNKWPDINNPAFRREVQSYLANFDAAGSGRIQAGQGGGMSSGSSGPQALSESSSATPGAAATSGAPEAESGSRGQQSASGNSGTQGQQGQSSQQRQLPPANTSAQTGGLPTQGNSTNAAGRETQGSK